MADQLRPGDLVPGETYRIRTEAEDVTFTGRFAGAVSYGNAGAWTVTFDTGEVIDADDIAYDLVRALPLAGQVLMSVENLDGPYDEEQNAREIVQDLDSANVVTSYVAGADVHAHRPVLDLDFPAHVVPSTTAGHSHLHLDVPLDWGDYARLLELLGDIGVLEPGYVAASLAREHTTVRLPWVRKPEGAGRPGEGPPPAAAPALVTAPAGDPWADTEPEF